MPPDLRERLLASYADMGEAMVAENVLESGGVACRLGELGGLPAHLTGAFGTVNRSVGIWVLEIDVERATALLAAMDTATSGVDEEALAAEALAAAEPRPGEPGEGEPVPHSPARASERREGPGFVRVAAFAVVAAALLLALRGCA